MESLIIAVAPTLATAILGYIGVLVKKISLNNKKTDKAITILLRHEMEELYEEFLGKDFITIEDIHDFDEVYEVYASLGGNGKGKTMYEKVHKMEIK